MLSTKENFLKRKEKKTNIVLVSKFSPIKKPKEIKKSIGFWGHKVMTREDYLHTSSYSCVKERIIIPDIQKPRKYRIQVSFLLRINFSFLIILVNKFIIKNVQISNRKCYIQP